MIMTELSMTEHSSHDRHVSPTDIEMVFAYSARGVVAPGVSGEVLGQEIPEVENNPKVRRRLLSLLVAVRDALKASGVPVKSNLDLL